MYRFRLKSVTVAVHKEGGRVAIIPTGAEIAAADLPDTRNGFEPGKFVTMEWDGRMVRMFLLDLMERGERRDRRSDSRRL
jgi:hypothetical protein